jgi:spore coat polysaccharide biosynthesis predicted glycosyltransferase SpsG
MGAGHVMRCWALAEEFCARGWAVAWQGGVEVPWVSRALAEAGWGITAPHGSPAEQAAQVDADLVVVDSYDLDHSYRARLLDRGTAVVAIVDDFHTSLGPASLWVNPGVPLPISGGSGFLNGPDYMLLRREIRELRVKRLAAGEPSLEKSGITFLLGGTDFAGIAHLVKHLPKAMGLQITMRAGPSEQMGADVTWLPAGSGLLQQAALSALVVTPAGVSSWEMLSVGVPLCLICATENQRGNYSWMAEQGWVWPLGDLAAIRSSADLAGALAGPLRALQEGGLRGESRIDGMGAERVVEAVIRGL